jgi:hypothetical protein
MPLKRLSQGYQDDLEGIRFGMRDEQRTVICLVTDAALTDAMGGNPTQAERSEWFVAHRSDIEEVASSKFDQGALEANGNIRVDTRDLNPHLFC